MTILAAMSIDVEDWFQVQNLGIPADRWEDAESRIEVNVDRMLEVMDERGVHCTCFILGWIAERHGDLIRRIAEAGHEIASHGYNHELCYDLTREEFAQDVGRTKTLLEDLTGKEVRGYRAPCFSITDWAIDVLVEEGYAYDSSSFLTVGHDRYGRLEGVSGLEPIVEIRPGFHEVCMPCLNRGKRGIPWAGGGYFRLLPYAIFRSGVRHVLGSGRPFVFYLHPWEIDVGQPRRRGTTRMKQWRHYLNIDRCERRWTRLLDDFQWVRIEDLLASQVT